MDGFSQGLPIIQLIYPPSICQHLCERSTNGENYVAKTNNLLGQRLNIVPGYHTKNLENRAALRVQSYSEVLLFGAGKRDQNPPAICLLPANHAADFCFQIVFSVTNTVRSSKHLERFGNGLFLKQLPWTLPPWFHSNASQTMYLCLLRDYRMWRLCFNEQLMYISLYRAGKITQISDK